jgi:serine/threonine-protein kinase
MALRGERYETLRVIASGGMATVHLGRALGAGGFERLVAIKVMHPHLASEPEFLAMFLDEARLAARIRHPNVVSTLDVQQDEGGVFLVMDFIEGPSLQQVNRALKKSGREMPLGILLQIFLDTLAGLHAAHELRDGSGKPLNLVHRDVSPQNILICVDGIARITDFGVARAEERITSTHSGQLKGKIGYMSPEQARSEPIDRRTDVYAAGVILWEALTGERLIRGANEALMFASVAASDHPLPREVNPAVPQALNDACMRALRRSPDDRFATAAAFADAIEKAAEADGISVASARTVAAFITALDLHTRPVDLPAAPVTSPNSIRPPASQVTPTPARAASSALASSAASPLSSRSGAPVSSRAEAAGDAALPSTTSPAVAFPLSSADPTPSSRAPALPHDASAPPEERRSSSRLLAILGIAAALSVAAAALVMTRGDGAEPSLAANAQSPAGAQPSANAQATSAAPSQPGGEQPALDAALDAGVSDASSAAAQAPSAPATQAAPTAAGGAPDPGKPAPRPNAGKPSGKGPVYRPPEL